MKKIICVLLLSFLMSLMAVYAQTDLETPFEEDMQVLYSMNSQEEVLVYSEELLKKYINDDSFKVMQIANRLFISSVLLERHDKLTMIIPIYTKAAKEVSQSDYFDVCMNIAGILSNRTDKYPDSIIFHAKQALKVYSKDLPVPMRQKKHLTEDKWKDNLNRYYLDSLNTSLGWGYYYKKNYSKALKYWPESQKRGFLLHKGIANFEIKKYVKAFQLIYTSKYYYDLDLMKYPEGLEEYYTKTLEKLPKKFDVDKEKAAIESDVKKTLLATLPQYEKKQDGIPFSLDIINGDRVSLESLKGKVVVLNLWSESCSYCKSEIPVLSKLHKEYADKGVVIIGANIGRKYSVDDVAMLKEKYGLEHPIANMSKELRDTFSADGIPQTYMYDKNGQLRYYVLGFKNGGYIVFKAQIDTLLAE